MEKLGWDTVIGSTLSALVSESDCRTISHLHTYCATRRWRRKIEAERKEDEKTGRWRRMAAPPGEARQSWLLCERSAGTLRREVGGNALHEAVNARFPRHDVELIEHTRQLLVDQQLAETLQQKKHEQQSHT